MHKVLFATMENNKDLLIKLANLKNTGPSEIAMKSIANYISSTKCVKTTIKFAKILFN